MQMNQHALQGTYDPAIDGLRFLAFMMVFVHHAPPMAVIPGAEWLKIYGWIGVDLFFTLSSYLLFSNLTREKESSGFVNVRRFYARRILRIFPLLLVYVLSMLILFGPTSPDWPLRLAGTVLFFDNILSWFYGYNGAVIATAHLWTLSFEFQFYILLPLIVFAHTAVGKWRFLAAGLLLCLVSTLARLALYLSDVGHPVVYVTPFLRPESIFAGIALATCRPSWACTWSALVAVVALAAALSLPVAWKDPVAAIVQYPLVAIGFAGLLDLALRANWLRAALCIKPIVYLGTISYGLYVIHYGVRHCLRLFNSEFGLGLSGTAFSAVMLTISVIMAAISYRYLEKPFLGLKQRLQSKSVNA